MLEKAVSILGCGWLGFPLALKLINNGYTVKGSTTSAHKIDGFKRSGIIPYLFDLREERFHKNLRDFLDSQYLIIAVPPGVRNGNDFKNQIKQLLPYIEKSNVQNVVFVSSTSVYPNVNARIDETSKATPDSKSGQVLLDVESMLEQINCFDTTILRMAGLYGYNRKPGRFLAGKKQLINPEGKVNLIHQDDCVEIIQQVIDKQTWKEVFNCCSDFHPTRREFYTKAALGLNLDPPEFSEEKSSFKIVDNSKLKRILEYSFKHPNPMDSI